MRSRPLAVLLVVIALAMPRFHVPAHHVTGKAALPASSAAWGRHRRAPVWHKRPCSGRGCIDIAVLDSSGLCLLCAPSPRHPGHYATGPPLITYTLAGLPMRKGTS